LAILALVGVLGGGAARAENPAVAQPSFPIDGEIQTRGIVFFVVADTPTGAAAVGTAHTFDLEKLVKVRRGDLVLGHSRRVVARADGFLVPPGRPFNAPGATVLDDYVVYSLDRRPEGVRLLALDPSDSVKPGTRVQVLGVPSTSPHDQDDLFGRVAEVSPHRIEVDLDVPYDLRGWGGAPVIDDRSKRVVGILQAYYPKGSTSRVIVAPVTKLRAALGEPLEGGEGHGFGRFADAARSTGKRRASQSARGSDVDPKSRGPIIKAASTGGTQLHLAIEYPPEGTLVPDSACGVFVSGRAVAQQGDLQRFDVMLVIDTSRSTIDPTGADINERGQALPGEDRLDLRRRQHRPGRLDPGGGGGGGAPAAAGAGPAQHAGRPGRLRR
jgi:hypothetical protein